MDRKSLRAAAQDPAFLSGVLEFVLRDEKLILAFSEGDGTRPRKPLSARRISRVQWRAPGRATSHEHRFCRDCLADAADNARRCPRCGFAAAVAPPGAATNSTAHIDCDAFYATIEKRDNPDLADKPVIVGGGKRGVVAACCYIARTFGVRSAMPMFKAKELCLDAVVVKPNMAKYVRVGREVRRAMEALTPLVEPLSIDEAFLDLSGTERIHGASAARTLAKFASEIERSVGITVSVGLSRNKFLAKVASDMDKPRGFAVLDIDDARAFLAPKPVGFIFGVGPGNAGAADRAKAFASSPTFSVPRKPTS